MDSYVTNFALKATLVGAASALLFGSVNCTAKNNICSNINSIKNTAAVIASVPTVRNTAPVIAFVIPAFPTVLSGVALLQGLSLGTFLSLASRDKRGKDAAESLFDGVVTDDGLFNGTKLLTAMQNFYATTGAIQAFYPGVKTKSSPADDQYVRADPAAISYLENGDAAIR